jgi:diphthine synthase
MLYLIGLGLTGDDIPHAGVEAAKKCSKVYCEVYTNISDVEKNRIGEILDNAVIFVTRADLEETTALIDEAERNDVALLVGGDPLAATTHIDLVLQARKRGIEVKIIHAASIFSAIDETGLQLYKFGKTASIVYPEEKFFPTSFYDALLSNKERGLHTLLLLDIQAEKKRYMNPQEAFEILTKVDTERILTTAIVVSRLGHETQEIRYGTVDELESCTYGDPPHCIVIPGDLHFMEEEYLQHFRVNR